ncbi:FMN-binding protein [Shewanella algae]|uniref:FMN-binding protein n=1 Tax=Shewanella algae TaxID=38313 RepID=UPI000D1248A3|nr:FMN-binding protein [Shewanella algae]MBO2570828.1 FMN-binding protein [Shewanella algae]MBO2621706.1 FMN-binding protein [Shewanella algae]MBO2646923.1 FMN-binding protein [Shewanella algae]MBO2655268.1 FMN-binding protein [Shewanella algae]MBO2680700.1 FMN-binding protein [Shewanella algae]
MKTLIALLSLFLLSLTQTQAAQSVYQSPADFVTLALGNQSKSKGQDQAKAKVFWFSAEQRLAIEEILAHDFRPLRTRYWQQGDDTVWILEEIGKEAPITVGIQVRHGQIYRTKVLIYRESRGDEVRHDFFTDQFKSATLTKDKQLDKHIDGITGATLSVRALTKLARIALYLDRQLSLQHGQQQHSEPR